jgi:predicted enzyme related to lactoylglutathione lyase
MPLHTVDARGVSFPIKTTITIRAEDIQEQEPTIAPAEVQPQLINLAYGTPIWFQVPAEDVLRAKKFYHDVFRWEFPDLPGPPADFMAQFQFPDKRLHQPGVTSGGIVRVDPKLHFRIDPAGDPLAYRGSVHMYLFVKDIDRTLKRIERAGGKALGGKMQEDPTSNVAHFLDSEGNVQGLYEKVVQEERLVPARES